MEISRPNAQEPTPDQVQELEKLKATIDRAVADCKISGEEMEAIRQEIMKSCHGSKDQLCCELELYRTMIEQKLESGELEREF